MRWSETDSNEDIDCDIADADASGEISKKICHWFVYMCILNFNVISFLFS